MLLNRSLLLFSFAIGLFNLGGGTAWAQTMAGGQLIPQHPVIDQNGVDLATGQWTGTIAHISIGDPQHGGMEWSQPANGSDSLIAQMTYGPGGNVVMPNYNGAVAAANGADGYYTPPPYILPADQTVFITISYLGKASHFYGLASPYESHSDGSNNAGQKYYFTELRQADGSTQLYCTISGPSTWSGCMFIAHDGTKINFSGFTYALAPNSQTGPNNQIPDVYQASNLVKPDGETWTYYGSSSSIPGFGWIPTTTGRYKYGYSNYSFSPYWQLIQRPAAIVSNRGYTIKYLWDSVGITDVVAYQTNQETCSPTASQCSFTHSWPNVHFTHNTLAFSNNVLTPNVFTLSVTDSSGAITQYSTTFSNGYQPNTSNDYPISTSIKKPMGGVTTLTLDTNYLNLGYSNAPSNRYPQPGNIEPPSVGNTQHIISVSRGGATWNYSYNYIYVDSGAFDLISPASIYGGRTGYEMFWLNLQTRRTNPLGAIRTVTSTPTGVPLADVDEIGRTTLLNVELPHQPNISINEGMINSIQYPAGNITIIAHGSDQNISSITMQPIAGSSTNSLTTTYNYPASCGVNGANYLICNKPISVIDPKGNEADYTYDPNHGGLLTETGPADPSGVRPQVRYSYQQFTATGQAGPIWLLKSKSTCLSATSTNPASCAGTAAETVTTYGYESGNLLPSTITVAQGDGSNQRVTSYTYDSVGNVSSVTDPKGNTSYIVWDALRRKVFEIGASPGSGNPRPILHHVYDADGNEIRTETGTGTATDGSDFTLLRYIQRTFDPATDLLTSKQEVAP